MKKTFLPFFSILALLLCGTPLVNKEPTVEAHAVSSTRLYIVVNDQIKAQATDFILWTGSANVNLSLLSTVDPYTYYTDAPITNTMTFKNNGGKSINLHNISHVGVRSTWDKIVFGNVSNWSGPAPYTTGVYTPPVPLTQYDITLYNGATIIGTQKATEGVAFSPTSIVVPGYTLQGWYTDATFTNAYSPTIFTANGTLYAKYVTNVYTRLYIESTNPWWYNDTPRMDIYFWKSGVTAQVLTMRKEVGNLHSVLLPHPSFTGIKIERIKPSDGTVWNATGDMTIDLSAHTVIKFSGPLANSYTGPLTVNDFSDTAPDISYLKTEVPLLSCTNYEQANDLLGAYNRLGANELSLINGLTTTTPPHGGVQLTYKSKIDYYVSYAASKAPASPRASTLIKSNSSYALLSVLGLGSLVIFSFYLLRKKKSTAE